MSSTRLHWVVRDGLRLAVHDHGGSGPLVVLLHGAERTAQDWSRIGSALTADYRVVALDLRGHGASDLGAWSWDEALDDLDAVIERFGATPARVVGHSLGGMLAAMYGIRHPEAPAVVNIDGHGTGRPDLYDGTDPELAVERMRTHAAFVDEVVCARTDLNEEKRAFLHGLMLHVRALDMSLVHRRCAADLLVYNAVAREPISHPHAPEWLAEQLASYRRGLVVDLEALAESRANVLVVNIDSTHDVLAEQPDAITRELQQFFSGKRRGSVLPAASDEEPCGIVA